MFRPITSELEQVVDILKKSFRFFTKNAYTKELLLWWIMALVYSIKVIYSYQYLMHTRFIYGVRYNDSDFFFEYFNDYIFITALFLLPVVVAMIFDATPIVLFWRTITNSKTPLSAALKEDDVCVTNKEVIDNNKIYENNIDICVCEYMKQLGRESHAIAERIYTKSGVYLITGIVIAVLGIVIFVSYTREMATEREFTVVILDLLPKFGVMFFVEFIAFYFFRQHRILMDEFRFYESIKRQRQSNLILIKLASENEALFNSLSGHLRLFDNPDKICVNESTGLNELRKLSNDELDIFHKILGLTQLIKPEKTKSTEGN